MSKKDPEQPNTLAEITFWSGVFLAIAATAGLWLSDSEQEVPIPPGHGINDLYEIGPGDEREWLECGPMRSAFYVVAHPRRPYNWAVLEEEKITIDARTGQELTQTGRKLFTNVDYQSEAFLKIVSDFCNHGMWPSDPIDPSAYLPTNE